MKKLVVALLISFILPVIALAAPEMPGIDGSNAYAVIQSLVNTGIKKPKTQHIDGGFQWTADPVSLGGAMVSYDIKANEDHEICSATFTLAGKDNGYLWFVSTFPFDSADKDASGDFVKEHMAGENASLTIGDALFEMMPSKNGAVLKISDVDAAAYYDELLNAKLGL